MNFRSFSLSSPRSLAVISVFALVLLAACSGGGSSSKPLRVTGSVFGFDNFTGNFGSTGQQGPVTDSPVVPQNMCVIFKFSAPLKSSSVSSESIVVQQVTVGGGGEINPGADAGVTFRVEGNRLIVCPLITFSDTNVSFGFEPSRAYQILFQVSPSKNVLRSRSGQALAPSDRGPYFFRTNDQIFDQKTGPPVPTVTLFDANTGAELGMTGTPFKPVPDLVIDFNEPVIPSTVVSNAETGASTSISVNLDVDRDVTTRSDRIRLPGRFTLVQDEFSAQVQWDSLLTELPTGPDGCVFVIRVGGTVTDISGNSRVLAENDPLAGDEFVFVTAPGPANSVADPVTETFETLDQADPVTSASWGDAIAGVLSSGVGGGRGIDGPFDPAAAGFPPANVAGQITVDVDNQLVTIDTEDQDNPGTQRVYEFLSFTLPLDWTAQGIGPFPLEIQVSGAAVVRGTLSVRGEDGETVDVTQGLPGAGGAAALGGAAGGLGGGVTNGDGTSTLFPSQGASRTNAELGFFESAVFDADHEGISGRIGSLTDFTLTDITLTTDLNTVFPDLTDVWIQPNVGADDFRFERFHPGFKVESVSGAPPTQTIAIVSDETDPLFRGAMTTETTNPYLEDAGGGVLRAPLLAEMGDAYLIGLLAGSSGSALFDVDGDGLAAETTVLSAGLGSEPQAVMQTFTTTARSGGGGGGGGTTTGSPGDDDPTVGGGPGEFGGTGGFGAAGGTAAPAPLVAAVLDDRQIRFQSDVFDDGAGGVNTALAGHLLNPQIGQGLTFTIESVDAVDTCTITPVATLGGEFLDLTAVNGLIANATARITPPYNVGGAGGGGSGVHCGGSGKDAKGNQGYDAANDPNPGIDDTNFYDDDDADTIEDFSEEIFRLPVWIPGAGGGAGGGALRMIVAGEVVVASTGLITADGGRGGTSTGSGVAASAGGGGGSGGTIFIGTGKGIAISVGGRISALGGEGGAPDSDNAGGTGGNGRIRVENRLGNMVPNDFSGVATPTITAEDLGIFPGGGNSLGQSVFLPAGVLVPAFDSVEVVYNFLDNGTPVDGAIYIVHSDGTVDPTSTLMTPPFELLFNFTESDPLTGLPVTPPPAGLEQFLDPAQPAGALSNFDGLPFLRFQIVLDDPSAPVFSQTNVEIDSIQVNVRGSKPQ